MNLFCYELFFLSTFLSELNKGVKVKPTFFFPLRFNEHAFLEEHLNDNEENHQGSEWEEMSIGSSSESREMIPEDDLEIDNTPENDSELDNPEEDQNIKLQRGTIFHIFGLGSGTHTQLSSALRDVRSEHQNYYLYFFFLYSKLFFISFSLSK